MHNIIIFELLMARVKSILLHVCVAMLFIEANFCYAQSDNKTDETIEDDSFKWSSLWEWPLEHIIQPGVNAIIYPIAKPIDYAFKNGVVEKTVDLITFGENQNIMIYPGFNFKPGSQTLIGFNYRHRGIVFDKDYLVLVGNYFANGDMSFTLRYTKHALFGTSFFGGFRYDMDFDRDNHFILPETKISYLEPDTSFEFNWRLGHPLNKSATLNAEIWTTLKFLNYNRPDIKDSLLISKDFYIGDRGLYQNMVQVPVGISLSFDNLDFPYAPSHGNRLLFSIAYNIVGDYNSINLKDITIDSVYYDNFRFESGKKNNDYISTDLVFQHYFYLGDAPNYVLSVKEGRKSRKFYTDFSLDDAIRVWRPEQVKNTLFERRVIALQYRMVNLWELEKGGAPHNAFPKLNAHTPLRGYGDAWSAHHMMSLSTEYRWPIDRFVDGVLFDEYAMIAPKINDWSFSRYYNSWGFGVRVRQPNLYLFRVQIGFHGLHGINLVITVNPEFK